MIKIHLQAIWGSLHSYFMQWILFRLWVSPAGSKVQKRVCLWHAGGRRERHRRREARERECCKRDRKQLINSDIEFWQIRGNMRQQCGECFSACQHSVHMCRLMQSISDILYTCRVQLPLNACISNLISPYFKVTAHRTPAARLLTCG